MPLKGTLTYKDGESNFSTMRFKAATGKTKADVATLGGVIDGYTACDRRATGFIDKDYVSAAGAGNRDVKGIVTVADVDGEVHKWALPGYNGATAIDKEGEHMIDPDLQAIVDAITALTGATYTVLRSPVIQTR
jgi:hypothetical protein